MTLESKKKMDVELEKNTKAESIRKKAKLEAAPAETTELALSLPDEQTFRRDIQAINHFQRIVHANMVQGHDFGIIPGTQKPTLLKPGAEKIVKLLGLADCYDILEHQEDWSKPFFGYLVKCRLVSIKSGAVIAEGLGECNSMESRYRWRWVFYSEVPESMDKNQMVTREIRTRNGRSKQYRMENEDIYSQVNTILKMAKKRALVDAALSAGRLSDIFTQDLEDRVETVEENNTKDKPEPASRPAYNTASITRSVPNNNTAPRLDGFAR